MVQAAPGLNQARASSTRVAAAAPLVHTRFHCGFRTRGCPGYQFLRGHKGQRAARLLDQELGETQFRELLPERQDARGSSEVSRAHLGEEDEMALPLERAPGALQGGWLTPLDVQFEDVELSTLPFQKPGESRGVDREGRCRSGRVRHQRVVTAVRLGHEQCRRADPVRQSGEETR